MGKCWYVTPFFPFSRHPGGMEPPRRPAVPARIVGWIALAAALLAIAPPVGGAGEIPAERAGDGWPDPGHPLGINQGIGAVPRRLAASWDFSRYGEQVRADAHRAAGLGARWYRANTMEYPWFAQRDVEESGWDMAHRDALVRALGERRFEVLLMIGPERADASCRDDEVYRPQHYAPRSEEGWRRFRDYVRRIVERYDGDGVDDMPGLARPVRWWQVDNEVDLKWQDCRARGIDYLSPEDYFRVVEAARQASKEADPEARLMTGTLVTIRRERSPGTDFVRRLFALRGGELARLVDAVDLHDYGEDPASLDDKLELIRGSLGEPRPIWLTETSVPSDPRAARGWDRRRQAGEVVRRVVRALGSGAVERVFWHSLGDAPPNPGNRAWKMFGTNSLWSCGAPVRAAPRGWTCSGREIKPAGAAFARLSEVLAGHARTEPLDGDGRTYRIVRKGRGDAVALWREGETRPVDLSRWLGRGPVEVVRTSGDPGAIRAGERYADARKVPVGEDPVLAWRGAGAER